MHSVISRDPKSNRVLVHCHAGQGRTAIVIGAYLIYANLASDTQDAVKKCQEGRAKLFTGYAYNS